MTNTDSLPRQFYSAKELSTICGLCPATIRSLIDSGRLKATNISQGDRTRWRIRFADWLDYCELNSNQAKPPEPPKARTLEDVVREYVETSKTRQPSTELLNEMKEILERE